MGEELRKPSGDISGQSEQLDGKTAGRSNGDSSRDTRPTNAKIGGTGRTDGGTGRTDGGTAEKEIVPQMVTVEQASEEQKRQERNARRRERYARQKAENGETVKPRKVSGSKAKNEPQGVDQNQINALFSAVTCMVASRPNMSHWLLDEKEIMSITTPLCNVLNKYEVFQKVGENTSEIALAVACVSVFAPRVMISVQQMKANKPNVPVKKEKTKHDENRETKGSNQNNNSGNDGRASANGSVDGFSLPSYFTTGY